MFGTKQKAKSARDNCTNTIVTDNSSSFQSKCDGAGKNADNTLYDSLKKNRIVIREAVPNLLERKSLIPQSIEIDVRLRVMRQ